MTHVRFQQIVSELNRGFRFLAVGCGGLATDAGLFLLLHGQGLAKPGARAVSLMAAALVTWTLNRLFTFEASGRSRRAELGRYGLVALGAQGFNYVLFLSLCAMAPHVPPLAFLLASAVAATAFSYTGQRFFTFNAAPARAA
ncbi:GtrA family protein [Phenylobacterium sp.]|jgi:putative flippase GtrA|uniref:GtrA family protein n=1 Tax=Phenylobacterium sp. TaxID=1871053 RepID=UPI002F3F4117